MDEFSKVLPVSPDLAPGRVRLLDVRATGIYMSASFRLNEGILKHRDPETPD
jgi:hypothetical protein